MNKKRSYYHCRASDPNGFALHLVVRAYNDASAKKEFARWMIENDPAREGFLDTDNVITSWVKLVSARTAKKKNTTNRSSRHD
jgi:hypothetical protein